METVFFGCNLKNKNWIPHFYLPLIIIIDILPYRSGIIITINFVHNTISSNLSDGKGGGFFLSNGERANSFPEDKLLNIDANELNLFGKTTDAAYIPKEKVIAADVSRQHL